jgi:hypothetical protein
MFHLFSIQFDIKTLEGKEIDLDGEEPQVLEEREHESVVLERVGEEAGKYMMNQVLPVTPGKNGKLSLT